MKKNYAIYGFIVLAVINVLAAMTVAKEYGIDPIVQGDVFSYPLIKGLIVMNLVTAIALAIHTLEYWPFALFFAACGASEAWGFFKEVVTGYPAFLDMNVQLFIIGSVVMIGAAYFFGKALQTS